jgi:hypothetical protein
VGGVSKWISVSERLPVNTETVVFYGEGGTMLGHYAADEWWDAREDWPPARKVTYWMPIPKPPADA